MARASLAGCRIAGIATTLPQHVVDNSALTDRFDQKEIRKVTSLIGVKKRHTVRDGVTSKDLCVDAAHRLMDQLQWTPESVDALIFVTQTPDYHLPSTSCLVHRDLGLSEDCAAYDVGLGCSGYPYGLWQAAMMCQSSNIKRVLLLHGETPSLFTDPDDRATVLLFGDAGSATGVESSEQAPPWHFVLRTAGAGWDQLVIPAGGFRSRLDNTESNYYVKMNGQGLFNFTIEKLPPLINDTLMLAGLSEDAVDSFIFHQSNKFMMSHIAKKCAISNHKLPLTINQYGNTGGPSVPVTLVDWLDSLDHFSDPKTVMLLGYGVGLSWGSALVSIDSECVFSKSFL